MKVKLYFTKVGSFILEECVILTEQMIFKNRKGAKFHHLLHSHLPGIWQNNSNNNESENSGHVVTGFLFHLK